MSGIAKNVLRMALAGDLPSDQDIARVLSVTPGSPEWYSDAMQSGAKALRALVDSTGWHADAKVDFDLAMSRHDGLIETADTYDEIVASAKATAAALCAANDYYRAIGAAKTRILAVLMALEEGNSKLPEGGKSACLNY